MVIIICSLLPLCLVLTIGCGRACGGGDCRRCHRGLGPGPRL